VGNLAADSYGALNVEGGLAAGLRKDRGPPRGRVGIPDLGGEVSGVFRGCPGVWGRWVYSSLSFPS